MAVAAGQAGEIETWVQHQRVSWRTIGESKSQPISLKTGQIEFLPISASEYLWKSSSTRKPLLSIELFNFPVGNTNFVGLRGGRLPFPSFSPVFQG
jgi:hypothetical protein